MESETVTDSMNNTVTNPDGSALKQDAGSNTKSCLEENFNASQGSLMNIYITTFNSIKISDT